MFQDLIEGPGTAELSSRLYVWDSESDSVIFHDFSVDRISSASRTHGAENAHNHSEDDDLISQDSNDAFLSSNHDVKSELAARGQPERVPVSHFWSSEDARLLTCEARKDDNRTAAPGQQLGLSANLDGSFNVNTSADVIISVFFVDVPTAPLLMLKDSFPMPSSCSKLVGFDVPYHFCVSKVQTLKLYSCSVL